MKLTNLHQDKHYDQESQNLDVRFAFVVETLPHEYVTLHNFVKCRDFLSDVIYWKNNNIQDVKIYGFGLTPVELGQFDNIIAIKADKNLIDNLIRNTYWAPFHIENLKRIDNETVILFPGMMPFTNPINTSLFSLMVKVMSVIDLTKPFEEQVKLLPQKEQEYINKIGLSFFKQLLSTHLAYSKKFPQVALYWDDVKTYKLDPYTLHENIGIVSVFNKYSPNSNIKRHFRQLKKQMEDSEKNPTKNNLRYVNHSSTTYTYVVLDKMLNAAVAPAPNALEQANFQQAPDAANAAQNQHHVLNFLNNLHGEGQEIV